jgi:hypothetical protein
LLGACAEANPCAALKAEVETAHAQGASRASHRVDIALGRRSTASGVKIIDRHDFMPTAANLSAMHACLGPDWRGGVETEIRVGWGAPAIVFTREAYPDVVLLNDARHLQILIEHKD